MKRLFQDNLLNEQFENDGFVVVPFVTAEQLHELKKNFANSPMGEAVSSGVFFYSLLANELNANLQLKKEIKNILQDSYQKKFENYYSVAESILAKPRTDEPLLLHQDWNCTDEEKSCSVTVWCPLSDVNKSNGGLFAIKGSHRFFKTYRSGSLPTSRIPATNGLEKHLTSIEIKEGEAVMFHPALFHGSFPNNTDTLRVIAASIILPLNTNFSYFHSTDNSTVQQYSITENDFFDDIKKLSRNETYPKGILVRTFDYHNRPITAEMLLEKINLSQNN